MRILPRLTPEQFQEVKQFAEKTKDVKELKRAQAILFLNANNPLSFIEQFTGYSRSQIFSLRAAYVRIGLTAVKTRRKGKPKRLLTKKQLNEIVETVTTKKAKRRRI